ncbi:MAG: condensin subunit Smc, partial [Frankiales bacterium]|nr:condensin subunit Smc [Frankiales bacterium]
ALRWAMGETSHKSLRAADMDAVIFAGSGSRASRNHAEVVMDRRGVLVAEQVGERRYLLGLAGLGRGVAPLGQVTAVGGPLSGGPERIRFDVMLHAAPAFRQDAGPLDALRRRSYERSRVAGPGAG